MLCFWAIHVRGQRSAIHFMLWLFGKFHMDIVWLERGLWEGNSEGTLDFQVWALSLSEWENQSCDILISHFKPMFWLAQEFCQEMLKLSKKLPVLPLPYPVIIVKMKKESQLKTWNNKEHKKLWSPSLLWRNLEKSLAHIICQSQWQSLHKFLSSSGLNLLSWGMGYSYHINNKQKLKPSSKWK